MHPIRVYRITRDLHLYAGLFISPFIVIYAISVVLLNHGGGGGKGRVTEVRVDTVSLSGMEDGLALARDIRRQLQLPGEIGFVRRNQARQTVSFPLEVPGKTTSVRVDLLTGITRIEQTVKGAGPALNFLHMKPGPHNVALRGNWWVMRMWSWLADTTVYLLLFVTASGVYLWSVIKAERKAGLISLGAGALCFLVALFAIVS